MLAEPEWQSWRGTPQSFFCSLLQNSSLHLFLKFIIHVYLPVVLFKRPSARHWCVFKSLYMCSLPALSCLTSLPSSSYFFSCFIPFCLSDFLSLHPMFLASRKTERDTPLPAYCFTPAPLQSALEEIKQTDQVEFQSGSAVSGLKVYKYLVYLILKISVCKRTATSPTASSGLCVLL